MPWVPQVQQAKMLCADADQILFGGAVGGGKTDALIGLSMTQKVNMLLMRRQFKSLKNIMARYSQLLGGKDRWSAHEQTWYLPNGSVVELGSAPNLGDEEKHQGNPHDILGIEEAAQWHESQITFLTTWLRSTDPTKKCRLMMTSNPPVGGQGRFLADWYTPWVDPSYPDPARSGEVRYFARVDNIVRECPPDPFEHKGRIITPFSRTFIRSTLADNEYLARTNYADKLGNLPDDMREALMNGDFMQAGKDQALQAIPSAWLKACNDRWTPEPPGPMTHVGVDVSRDGNDRTVIYCRHGNWVAEPIILRGAETARGGAVAARILSIIEGHDPMVYVDVVGVGSSVYDHLEPYLEGDVIAVNGGSKSTKVDATGASSFFNLRSERWWKLRERMTPGVSRLAIPPNNGLFQELCTPSYTVSGSGIKLQTKESVINTLGYSTDMADALVLAVG